MTLTASSSASSLGSRTGTDLSAVHLFSSGIPLADSTAASTHSAALLGCTGAAAGREAAALEDLVAALNKENARLLVELKRRDQQLEHVQVVHGRDLKRLRDEVELQRQEMALSQLRRFDDTEDGKTKEILALRAELHAAQAQFRDKEHAMMHEINRLAAMPHAQPLSVAAPSSSALVAPVPAPLPPAPLSASSDERDEYIAHLQRVLHDKDQHIRQLTDKLAWYAENQQLIARYEERAQRDKQRIAELEKAKAAPSAGPATSRSVPTDLKKIKALEREVELLRRKHSRAGGEDGAVAGMIEAARPSVEESEAVRELNTRLGDAHRALEERDADWERRLRAIRQEQERIRLGYEKKVKALEDATKGKLGQLKRGPLAAALPVAAVKPADSAGEDVVREMERRMEEMRHFYELRIEQLTSGLVQPPASLLSPPQSQRPTSPVRSPTPAAVTLSASSSSSARSRRALPRSAVSSKSPQRTREAPGLSPVRRPASAAARHRSLSPVPRSAAHRAGSPAPLSAPAAAAAASASALSGHGAGDGVRRAEVERELHHLQSVLQSAHKEELSHLSSHYASLFASLQSQMAEQVSALQRRVEDGDDKAAALSDKVRELQLDLWKRDKELQEKAWEVDRFRSKPGVREYVLLEREVKELQERLQRREREFREESDSARLREDEERARTVGRFEALLRRKNDQIRAFEEEMDKLVSLVRAQQHTARHAQQQQQQSRSAAQRADEEEDEEKAEEAHAGVGGPTVAPVPNYVALLERLEHEGGALFEEAAAGIRSASTKPRGKENTKTTRPVSRVGASGVQMRDEAPPRVASVKPAAPRRPLPRSLKRGAAPVRSTA